MPLLPSTSKLDLAARDSFRARRQRRLAAGIGWRYSLLLVAALLAIGVVRLTGVGPDGGSTRTLSFRVTDGATGAPLPGASVSLGGVAATADEAGIARFKTGWQTQAVVVSARGYQLATVEIARGSPDDRSISLQPAGSTSSAATRATTRGTLAVLTRPR